MSDIQCIFINPMQILSFKMAVFAIWFPWHHSYQTTERVHWKWENFQLDIFQRPTVVCKSGVLNKITSDSKQGCFWKNWREPSTLNLWNPECPAYDFHEKTKISYLPKNKRKVQGATGNGCSTSALLSVTVSRWNIFSLTKQQQHTKTLLG